MPNAGSDVGYVVGVVGLGVGLWRYRIDQRRARPIVICHEEQKRTIDFASSRNFWMAEVSLTNESSASAFNIRFGINIDGNLVHWKHNPDDKDPSRLNVMRPGKRHSDDEGGVMKLVIPDQLVWGVEGDPEEGRAYWAYYQGPAGDWWFTSNPSARSDDLQIERIGSRRWGRLSRRQRKFNKTLGKGAALRTQSIRDLNAAVERNRAEQKAIAEESESTQGSSE